MEHVVDTPKPLTVSSRQSRDAEAHASGQRAADRVFGAGSRIAWGRSVTFKLFAVLLAQSLLVILAFSLLVGWAFNHDFSRYMSTFDDQRAQEFARTLERQYASDGSWDALAQSPQRWAELTMAAAGHKIHDVARLLNIFAEFSADEFPASLAAPLPLRFVLLDSGRRIIFGRLPASGAVRELPLQSGGVNVGTLAFALPAATPDDLRFQQRFLTALVAIVALSLLLAMVPGLLIARQVTRPVSNIAQAARRLATGNLAVQLPVDSNDEFGNLARDFNDLSAALSRHQNLERQWLAEISHELRTPVAILRMETEALLDGMREPSHERFKSLHDETCRLSRLIDDLHQLSLMDGEITKLQLAELRLTDLLADCIDAYATRFSDRNIAVTNLARSSSGLRLIGDADRLRQVFMNLLENSLRYTDSGGEVRISAELSAQGIHVRMEDSSPGVPEHEVQHLFERLYRGESSRNRASGGAGLGLAIVQSIVRAHGGEIRASSSPLGGLRFDLLFRQPTTS